MRKSFGFGIAGMVLALALFGCGGGAAPSDAADTDAGAEGTEVEEVAGGTDEGETAEDAQAALTPFETSYLSIGIADGWTANPDGDAEEPVNTEDEGWEGYALSIRNDAEDYYLTVTVYDNEVLPDEIGVPEESEYFENVVVLDPVAFSGTQLEGWSNVFVSGFSGDRRSQAEFAGSANGHFIEAIAFKGTDEPFSDQEMADIRAMLESAVVL